jgi:nicotinamide-nucleotide amidase
MGISSLILADLTVVRFLYQIMFLDDKDLLMKASILAIGTELTTGQIVNRNATTISEKLKAFGVTISTHLTVPDDKKIILQSLEFIEKQSDLLFITGGLGPTSDDFTRDVVAEWANLKMQFHDESWKHIQERLTSRGFKVRDMQKQQCYFPEDSQILFNSEGTANGFSFNTKNIQVYVLPGPPREIEAIWKAHIQNDLTERTKHISKTITKSWDTIGVGESEVAFQVEEILKDRSRDEYLDIGYRVHLPYVEVKLTFLENKSDLWSLWINKIDKALNPITVTRDFTDVAKKVSEKLADIDFTFYDFASEGYLHSRISPYLKNIKNWSFKQSSSILSLDMFENEDDFIALIPYEDDKCIVAFSIDGQRKQLTLEAPMKSPLMTERRKQYYAELALVELSKS